MPDLLTHFAVAYITTRTSRFARFRVIFYVGAILPDILTRPFYILLPKLSPYSVGLHTPLFMAIFCIFFAELFEKGIRSDIRTYLFAGVGLHFFLDLLQKPIIDGYYWFFPFSWKTYSIGLFSPHEFLYFVPFWIILIIIIEIGIRWRIFMRFFVKN